MRFILKITLLAILGIAVTSCSDIETNADPGIEAQEFGVGSNCLELVFPLSIILPDGTEIEVESREDIKAAKQEYKEANPDERAKISFVFPLDVTDEEGETTTVESAGDLKALKKACRNSRGKTKCVELVYPISFLVGDGTTITGQTRAELKASLKEWKESNPDASEKPQLVFPIEIINSEGETVEVADAETLAEIKEDCKGKRGSRGE